MFKGHNYLRSSRALNEASVREAVYAWRGRSVSSLSHAQRPRNLFTSRPHVQRLMTNISGRAVTLTKIAISLMAILPVTLSPTQFCYRAHTRHLAFDLFSTQ